MFHIFKNMSSVSLISQVHKTQNSTVSRIENSQTTIFKVTGLLKGKELEEAYFKSFNVSSENGDTNFVLDFELLEMIQKADVDWLKENLEEGLTNNGVKNLIAIEPKKPAGRLSFKRLLSRELIKKFDMKFFLNEEKAFDYILNVSQV